MTKAGCRCKELGDAIAKDLPDGVGKMTTVLLEWEGGHKKLWAGPLIQLADNPFSVYQELVRQACDFLLQSLGDSAKVKDLKWSIPKEQCT